MPEPKPLTLTLWPNGQNLLYEDDAEWVRARVFRLLDAIDAATAEAVRLGAYLQGGFVHLATAAARERLTGQARIPPEEGKDEP